jgi:AcrR family transcriptional regulator
MDFSERIISTAIKLFKKFGVRSVTMDQIAAEAGASKRTIYESFKDKSDLLAACLQVHEDEIIAFHEKLIKESANIIDAMFKVAEFHIASIENTNPLFLLDIQKFYPNLWDENMRRISHNKLQEIRRFLEIGQKQKLIRSEINLDLACRIIHQLSTMALSPDILNNSKYNGDEVFNNTIINYLRGITTEQGTELLLSHNLVCNKKS